jgi:glycosyltransferase involved in cell wall biosynthesis
VSVVVAVANAAEGLRACLDELLAQPDASREVVVVDRLSSDGSADVALRHPVVDRVVFETQTHPLAAYDKGAALSRGDIMAFVEAGRAPPVSEWLTETVDALRQGIDVAWSVADDANVGAHGVVATRRVSERLLVGDGGPMIHAAERFRLRAAAAGFVVREGHPDTSPMRAAVGLITVAVCTDGVRRESLARCLDSIAELRDDKYEVLVVKNSPRTELQAELDRRGFRHVHVERPGLDVCRNRAIDEAVGDVVAFVDDDCEVDPGWLDGLRSGFADAHVTLVTGRVVPASLVRPTQRWFEAWFSFDRGPAPQLFTRHDRRMWFPLFPSALGTGCNMAFHRATFMRVARFDPALDMGTAVGGGGDLDIFAQFLDADEVAAYAPEAVVRHHHRSEPRELRRQFFGYGAAQGALCFKYALGRPGQRRAAVQFFRSRLREHRFRRKDSKRNSTGFPPELVTLEAAGQLAGPALYLWARWRSRD